MSLLFTPKRIGTMEIRNRFVRSATAERGAADDGSPHADLAGIYRKLAEGGVGLIISGHMYVAPSGKAHPGMVGIYDDFLIEGLAPLAGAAHAGGAKVAVQLNHAGRQADPQLIQAGQELVAPSALPNPATGAMPRELSPQEIEGVIQAFGRAAWRAKEAGFDAVQIHGAHGYLVNQFLSPAANRRQDRWGGDMERRLAFLGEVCRGIRWAVGESLPVFIKLGVEDFCPGGLRLAEGLGVAKRLEEWGMDALEVSGGIAGPQGASSRRVVHSPEDEAYFLPWVREVRKATRLPLVIVGGLRSRAVMEQILEEGAADFVSLSRPFVREPDLAKKFRLEESDRAECASCDRCWEFGPTLRCGALVARRGGAA